MANGIASNLPTLNQTTPRSPVTSTYDSGYEYSFDHYVDVRLLVQNGDKEASDIPATYASAF